MAFQSIMRGAVSIGLALGLAACGSNWAGTANPEQGVERDMRSRNGQARQTIWDTMRGGNSDANHTIEVNKYLWNASLEVLDFLPIESVDPFTGVIVTGYGTPPGSGRAYRATVYVQDPALDARSLKVSLQTRGGGPVATETVKAVEDAILTRARQLRIRDSKF
jgi:hypothetical protein